MSKSKKSVKKDIKKPIEDKKTEAMILADKVLEEAAEQQILLEKQALVDKIQELQKEIDSK